MPAKSVREIPSVFPTFSFVDPKSPPGPPSPAAPGAPRLAGILTGADINEGSWAILFANESKVSSALFPMSIRRAKSLSVLSVPTARPLPLASTAKIPAPTLEPPRGIGLLVAASLMPL